MSHQIVLYTPLTWLWTNNNVHHTACISWQSSWVEVHSVCTYWTSWSWSSNALCTKCFKLKYTTHWTKCVLSLQIRTSCIRLSPLYISQCIAHHNNFILHSLHSRVPTIAQCIHIIAQFTLIALTVHWHHCTIVQCTVHCNCTHGALTSLHSSH